MTDWYDPDNEKQKPGGSNAFGGGKINKHRKIHDVPSELIQAAQNTFGLMVRRGWDYNKYNHELGIIFNNIRKLLNHGDLKPFLSLHLNHISVSTVDRARRVASNVDVHQYPSFLSIAQAPLLKMLRKYSFDEAVNLLKINGANLHLHEHDIEGIQRFQCLFRQLLKGELALQPDEEENEVFYSENDDQLAEESDSQFIQTEPATAFKRYVSHVKELHQFHDDTGSLLDKHIAFALAETLVEASNVLLKFGPTITRDKKFKEIHAFLTELHDVIFESLIDEEVDTVSSNSNDNGNSETAGPTKEEELESYYINLANDFEQNLHDNAG